MSAFLVRSEYAEAHSLHRYITEAGVVPNIDTYNLIIYAYVECGEIDTAMEQYKQLLKYAPFSPNRVTYRIIVKGLVDKDKLDKALEVKDATLLRGLADPTVSSHLMSGQAKNQKPDEIFNLYEELKEYLDEFVVDGVVYGGVVKGYFLKGMDKEALNCCYEQVLDELSSVQMSAMAYHSIMEALIENGKFNVAENLFDKMLAHYTPPTLLDGTYKLMRDGYCAKKYFDEAINMFNKLGGKLRHPDTYGTDLEGGIRCIKGARSIL